MSQRIKLADIEAIEIEGDKDAPIIILLHGYGASAHDLYPLHAELSLTIKPSWYFPNGIVKVPLGPHIYGRAWFPIDMEALLEARARGTWREMSRDLPLGIGEAQKKINDFMEALQAQKKMSSDEFSKKVFIGGFSQGAMLSTQVVLNREDEIAKLILLSGTLLAKEEWTLKAKNKKNIKYFQSHGQGDMVLPFEMAMEWSKILDEAGWKGEFHSFSGGHEIPYPIVKKLEKFIYE